MGVAIGPDGSLYIAERDRIRRVGPDGVITSVAGNAPLSSSVTADQPRKLGLQNRNLLQWGQTEASTLLAMTSSESAELRRTE